MAVLDAYPTLAENVIPMIHVDDLAAAIYKVGALYDILDDRYMFAVDRGNLTVRKILQAIDARIGSGASATPAASSATAEASMSDYLDAALPAPLTNEELRARFQNSSTAIGGDRLFFFGAGASPNGDLLRSFLLSSVQAEPAALLGPLPEESWTAVEGFTDAIDAVAFQFKKARGLAPRRVLVAGPPMSGAETIAAATASAYGVPLLTAESVESDFAAHVTALRGELADLLAGRVHRRWARGHARRAKEALAERHEAQQQQVEEKEERRRAKAEARRVEGAGSGEDDDDDDDDDDEDEEEDEDGGSHAVGDDGSHDTVSELSLVFPEEASYNERYVTSLLTEKYLQGYDEDGEELLGNEGEDEEEDEEQEIFAQAEEDAMQAEADDEEEGNAGASRGHRRALAAVRAAEMAEKARIRALRLEYHLALKALSMKLVNGALPRPRNEDDDEEDEEDSEMNDIRDGGGSAGRGSNSEDGDNDNDEEDEGEADGDEKVDGSDEEGEGEEDGEGDTDSVPSSVFTAAHRARAVAASGPLSAGGGSKKRGAAPHQQQQQVQYLDEAKAFFMRWRLRCPDCRTTGYVLLNFPATVRQACLTFYGGGGGEDGEDEGEGSGDPIARHILPAATAEEVPPPADADFPFANFSSMAEEQLLEVEADVRNDRLRLVDLREEGVLAAVHEGSFPEHVVVLDDRDVTLQALAAAMAAQARLRTAAGVDRGSAMTFGSGSPLSAGPSGAGSLPDRQLSGSVRRRDDPAAPAVLLAGSSADNSVAVEAVATAQREWLAAVAALADSHLVTGDSFYKALSSYRKHNQMPSGIGADAASAGASTAAPSPMESVVTWLQSVMTRAAIGASAEPVMIHAAKKNLGVSGEEDGEGEDDNDNGGEENGDAAATGPATSARSAQVLLLTAPPRDAASMRAELIAVLAESKSITVCIEESESNREDDGGGGIVSPRYVVAPNCPRSAALPPLSQLEQPLQWLAEKLLRTALPPPALDARGIATTAVGSSRVHFASSSTVSGGRRSPTDHSQGGDDDDDAAGAEIGWETTTLSQLRATESVFTDAIERGEEAEVLAERNFLRSAQLKEEVLGVWAAAGLPKETYIMKYILPRLTPAMREVVRLRPEDAVTALAEILYNQPC